MAPWVAGPSLPTATTAAAAIAYGSAVDLFGGYHGTQATSAVLQLAYGATAWNTTTSLNSSRAAGGAAESGFYPSNNGDSTTDIFNFGGVSGGQTTNSVSNYTSESTFAPMSTARSYFAYVAAPGNTDSTNVRVSIRHRRLERLEPGPVKRRALQCRNEHMDDHVAIAPVGRPGSIAHDGSL